MIKAVIFDYGNTIEDEETGNLFPQTPFILENLAKKGLKLALVSRAPNLEERLAEFKHLNLRKYFVVLEAVPIGVNKEFSHIIEELRVEVKECLVVGDRLESEILEGNKIGAKTVWIKHGSSAEAKPETDFEKPDYTISSLEELISIVDNLSS